MNCMLVTPLACACTGTWRALALGGDGHVTNIGTDDGRVHMGCQQLLYLSWP